MNGHALRELAQAWATVVHDGQCRKGAGEPYINHCQRVSERVWGWRAKALAWLHDTIEDAEHPETMAAALRTVFPSDFVRDLLWLSRIEDDEGNKQSYQEWIEAMARTASPDVIAVKLADLEDNMADISDIPGAQHLQTRYLRAKATLLEAQAA